MATPLTAGELSQTLTALSSWSALQEQSSDITLGSLEIFDSEGESLGVIYDQMFHPGGVAE